MSNRTIQDPHDAIFRSTMCDVVAAREFFINYLPTASRQHLHLPSLRLASSQFLTDDLKKSASDLVYQVDTIEGNPSFILMSEHQSSADKLMAYRILKYNSDILDLWLKQCEIPMKDVELPVIINMVIYHGRQTPYPYTESVFDLFASPALAKRHSFTQFHLVDLTKISDKTLQKQAKFGLMALFQKHIFSKDLLPIFEENLPFFMVELKKDEKNKNFIRAMVYYIAVAGEMRDEQRFLDIVQKVFQNEVNLMSLAQKWRQEGVLEGQSFGLEQGLEMGQKNVKNIAFKLINLNFTNENISEITSLSISEIVDLKKQKNANFIKQ